MEVIGTPEFNDLEGCPNTFYNIVYIYMCVCSLFFIYIYNTCIMCVYVCMCEYSETNQPELMSYVCTCLYATFYITLSFQSLHCVYVVTYLVHQVIQRRSVL